MAFLALFIYSVKFYFYKLGLMSKGSRTLFSSEIVLELSQAAELIYVPERHPNSDMLLITQDKAVSDFRQVATPSVCDAKEGR